MLKWTSENNAASQAEGWLLTYAYTCTWEGYQIEKFDEASIFDGDYEAVAFVADRAMRDDPLAMKAIAFIKENNGRLHK